MRYHTSRFSSFWVKTSASKILPFSNIYPGFLVTQQANRSISDRVLYGSCSKLVLSINVEAHMPYTVAVCLQRTWHFLEVLGRTAPPHMCFRFRLDSVSQDFQEASDLLHKLCIFFFPAHRERLLCSSCLQKLYPVQQVGHDIFKVLSCLHRCCAARVGVSVWTYDRSPEGEVFCLAETVAMAKHRALNRYCIDGTRHEGGQENPQWICCQRKVPLVLQPSCASIKEYLQACILIQPISSAWAIWSCTDSLCRTCAAVLTVCWSVRLTGMWYPDRICIGQSWVQSFIGYGNTKRNRALQL